MGFECCCGRWSEVTKPVLLGKMAEKWRTKVGEIVISLASLVVFTFLDLLEILLCIFYKCLDAWLEKSNTPSSLCYCCHINRDEEQMSETLYKRKNFFRNLGIFKNNVGSSSSMGFKALKSRWSDCSCNSCLSWQKNEEHKLHVVVMEPSKEFDRDCTAENVIFLHGFLSSSSFWVESVFPNISEAGIQNYRLFAVDLLGFGKSPKPWDCSYTLKDHIEMIEQSVIIPSNLKSFHLVAHSMGCIIALGLTSKYSESIKSITLVAPPYFPSSKEEASLTALNRLAERTLWPPLMFFSSVMSWYEHLGRSICFLYCRNHQRWESVLKFFLRTRELHFMILDSSRHTHHSAWHTMHNVLCGGAKKMDEYLEAVKISGAVVTVIHGDKDRVVPLECSNNLKMKIPRVKVEIISNADHNSVIFGREQQFTRDLQHIWR